MEDFEKIKLHIVEKLKRELPPNLYYHGLHHTMDVLKAAEMIGNAEGIDEQEMLLLKTAVLYHDAGFTKVYKNHEEVGCELARKELPGFGFRGQDIDQICGMIMATKIPQSPKAKLEYIIADADLEYLGTDAFEKVGATLFEEMKLYTNLEGEKQWNRIQLNFLNAHRYFTDFCRKNREEAKQKHLAAIRKIVASYD